MGLKARLFTTSQKGSNVLRRKKTMDLEDQPRRATVAAPENNPAIAPSSAAAPVLLPLRSVDTNNIVGYQTLDEPPSTTSEPPPPPYEAQNPEVGSTLFVLEDGSGGAAQLSSFQAPVQRSEPLFPESPSDLEPSTPQTASERKISKLPAEIWCQIASHLSPADAARLAYSSKTLRYPLGSGPWNTLDLPDNQRQKIEFLASIDRQLPDHLLCFLCASYHRRIKPGTERIRPSHVVAPVFACPNARIFPLPRSRLTHGRELPFTLVQLTSRAENFSPDHGISLDTMARRWKCKDSDWSHAIRFHFGTNGHLLMRSTSTCFASANLTQNQVRLLLFSRNDYAPYFSVCAHWMNGDLLKICKCALSHVPAPKQSVATQLRQGPTVDFNKTRTNILPKQCDECKPLRRCRECPTEYLVQLKLVEDTKDRINPFKQAICVTRWSDLGDCSSPFTPEWQACNGEREFDSATALQNATLCSLFEAAVSNGAPGERVVWLNQNPRRRANGSVDDVY